MRSRDRSDLDQAITWAEEALAAGPPDHPSQVGRLEKLGALLHTRFEWSGALQDLEQALSRSEQALVAAPLDSFYRGDILVSLARNLLSKYRLLRHVGDLEHAIDLAREAVTTAPPNHPGRGGVLLQLSLGLASRYLHTPSTQDFNEILDLQWAIWHCSLSWPRMRIRAAYEAGMTLAATQRWQESSSLLEGAVRMLLQLSPRILSRDD